MKISYHWLLEMLDKDAAPSIEKIEDMLTFGAFEVEGIEKVKNDAILDVKILANRAADCLSHRGIAQELSVLLRHPLAHDPFADKIVANHQKGVLAITIEDKELCQRYIGSVVEGVTVGPSPAWLRDRLEALGQRSINNIVDITNYVMLETGQPLHAFDADKLVQKDGGWHIGVRHAHQGETITTLTGEVYPLGEKDLVIADMNADRAIGIAGVKGGKYAEITTDTKNIIIEAATFNWLSVRRTAKRHTLATDASKRFEHALSPHLAHVGMTRALTLVGKHAAGTLITIEDTNPNPPQNPSVSVSATDVEKILGIKIPDQEIESMLKMLRFHVSKKDSGWSVVAPPERTDITIPEDIIEEIGRVHGLQFVVPQKLPESNAVISINQTFAKEELVRRALTELGFSEVTTSVFVPKKDGEVQLENPIAEDKPMMRARIATPGMEVALSLNARNAPLLGMEEIKIFEIGTVYTKSGEQKHLALGVHAQKQKRALELLHEAISNLETSLSVSFGEVGNHGSTIREFNLSKIFENIPDQTRYPRPYYSDDHVRYQPISSYPFVLRDIAVWTPLGIESAMVAARIDAEAGPLLVRKALFDEFKKEHQVSFAFHLVFQSKEKTLTAADVQEYINRIEGAIKRSGWTVR